PNTVFTATRATRDVLAPLYNGAEELLEKSFLSDADLRKLLSDCAQHAVVLADDRSAPVRRLARLRHVPVRGQQLGQQLRSLGERKRGQLILCALGNVLPLRPEQVDDAFRPVLLAYRLEQRGESRVVCPREQRLASVRQRIAQPWRSNAVDLTSALNETLGLELLEVSPETVGREVELSSQLIGADRLRLFHSDQHLAPDATKTSERGSDRE